jgi:phenylacetate-coenzyme A ligase PaaK-like adenylate-forming protein
MRERTSERTNPIDSLCALPDPTLGRTDSSELFLRASRHAASHHQNHNSVIAHLYAKAGFSPDQITKSEDLAAIPTLSVHAMKYHLLLSLPEQQAVLRLTSSGTRGQKTQVFLDQNSLARAQDMLLALWSEQGFVDTRPTNYLLFVYDPAHAKDLGIAFTMENQMRFAPARDNYFTIRRSGDSDPWEFDIAGTLATLRRYCAQGSPVRILGMPSFLFDFLAALPPNEEFILPEGSAILTGGGWKAAEDKSITRARFRSMLSERLGIPVTRIRDGYGMAEHCAPYMECSAHAFHVPAFCEVLVRNPENNEPVATGEVGLLNLITPFNSMMPTLSLLTTDAGRISPERCTCGANSPTFEILGRAGTTKHKGCALSAADLVRRKS